MGSASFHARRGIGSGRSMRVRTVVALVLAGAMSGCTTQPAMPLDTITNASLAARSEISPEQRLRGCRLPRRAAHQHRLRAPCHQQCRAVRRARRPSFGFRLWSLEDFDPPNRPAAIAAFGLGDRLQVYATAEGQPAWNAGVRAATSSPELRAATSLPVRPDAPSSPSGSPRASSSAAMCASSSSAPASATSCG